MGKYLIYTETFPYPDGQRHTGIGRYCHDLASGLAKQGHEVSVFTHAAPDRVDVVSKEGFKLHACGDRPGSVLGILRRRRKVRQAVTREAPDWVVVGDPEAQTVYSLLHPSLPVPYCPVFYGSELKAMKASLQGGTMLPHRWLHRKLLRESIRAAPERVCISEYTTALLTTAIEEEKSSLLLYPAVSEIFLSRKRDERFTLATREGCPPEPASSPLKVITVGRISERKNQLRVLQILAQLGRAGSMAFHYYILGNIDSGQHRDYFEEIERFIQANGLQRQVSVVTGTTDGEKIDYIDACDLFIMLSKPAGPSVEGFGISVIEASCRGKPVVVSTEGGMPETIVDGITGYVVDASDDRAVGEAIVRLSRDAGLRARMGKSGRKYVEENFTQAVMAERFHRHMVALQSMPRQPDVGRKLVGSIHQRG